jgi:hypothetical protein
MKWSAHYAVAIECDIELSCLVQRLLRAKCDD